MPGASLHQAIPVVVRDLVAEMTEQGAVGLAHLPPHALAFGIVGLGQVDGDEAVVMAGHHRLGRRAVAAAAAARKSNASPCSGSSSLVCNGSRSLSSV